MRIKGSSNYFWDIGQFGNNDFIEFRPNGQSNENRTVLMQNGNMGIGTITPTKKLDVNGDARIGNITSRQYLKVFSKEWPELRFETPTSN
ncbi:hypothetical protein SB49_13990 [Sediminicola sp. YIK13]|uniref:hypothetical protein n=1 Tax=Sediminicola sp. YIK13 TaxID=1453352 RepID=UPI0007204F37|nr:hypothetical protein [Sediminicola sp. YIK13]ALM08796.1 hypothetical protein SB49_13990 [Sediminicola sp. YIK13]